MSKYWEPCPKCGSNKVETRGKAFWFFLLLGSGSVLIWIGLFFMPLLFVSIALIFLSPLAFFMPKVNQCKDCKNSWKVDKKKFEEATTNV